MTSGSAPSGARTDEGKGQQQQADVLVVFGITGDLATRDDLPLAVPARAARAARLPDRRRRRRRLDAWTSSSSAPATRSSGPASSSTRRCSSGSRRGSRMCQGDFADAATYERVAEAIEDKERPVFYLEIPPFLFGTVVKGLPRPD